ncbi:MAG: 4-hydroxyphenylpyruvate dioxygenase [Scytonema sp. PMC 1069.18]|nr:4-hydroxyphenylpyruvate dioxygenase [Scytonema sp. PMC 1069.18]MEC4886480.1 4-hydroxyphenylpyruvate dioxygenase [Scytonema sp. PMC 1070.18]
MKIKHVHFYVENAKVWRDWFVHKLGFQALGTNMSSYHTHTEVVKSGSVCFLLSSALLPISPVAEFLSQHPPGVADIAFGVKNVEDMISRAQAHGVKVLQPVQSSQQGQEYIKSGKIAAWGSLSHTLIEIATEKITDGTDDLSATRLVSNFDVTSAPKSVSYFTNLDHVVLNVAAGELERAVAWYENVLGFQPQQIFKIKTTRSALHSQVMVSPNGSVQFPINEPASSNSQIQEFLDVNRGAGIQHIALGTCNLIPVIAKLRANGLCLLPAPRDYYSQIQQRGRFPLSLDELQAVAQQEILVDWQDNHSLEDTKLTPVLLQIFTQPIFGQPTFFFEFIERRYQARGFGEGNFRALFKAIENEQLKRGSLKDSVT